MKTALIIGGGFAGCASAHQLSLLGGWEVTLVESAPFLGAGVKTQWYGGHPHTFGPRHFLTRNEEVFHFLNSYIPLRRLDHEFITYVESDRAFYTYPIHKDDVARMPDQDRINGELSQRQGVENVQNLEEYWVRSVGETLYRKFVDKYSKKMWMINDNKLIDDFAWSPKGVALKEGPRAAWDIAISAYPYAPDGYDEYFRLSTKEANVLLATTIEAFDIQNKTVVIDSEKRKYDIIINTISPDILFDFAYGQLPYVGRDLHRIVLPVENCFPDNVYFIYYANEEKFTRLVEYKKFTLHQAPTTLVAMEIPSSNGRHYPMPFKSEQERAQRYFDEMPDGVFSIGRAGSYLYRIDIDDCIEQAIGIKNKLAS